MSLFSTLSLSSCSKQVTECAENKEPEKAAGPLQAANLYRSRSTHASSAAAPQGLKATHRVSAAQSVTTDLLAYLPSSQQLVGKKEKEAQEALARATVATYVGKFHAAIALIGTYPTHSQVSPSLKAQLAHVLAKAHRKLSWFSSAIDISQKAIESSNGLPENQVALACEQIKSLRAIKKFPEAVELASRYLPKAGPITRTLLEVEQKAALARQEKKPKDKEYACHRLPATIPENLEDSSNRLKRYALLKKVDQTLGDLAYLQTTLAEKKNKRLKAIAILKSTLHLPGLEADVQAYLARQLVELQEKVEPLQVVETVEWALSLQGIKLDQRAFFISRRNHSLLAQRMFEKVARSQEEVEKLLLDHQSIDEFMRAKLFMQLVEAWIEIGRPQKAAALFAKTTLSSEKLEKLIQAHLSLLQIALNALCEQSADRSKVAKQSARDQQRLEAKRAGKEVEGAPFEIEKEATQGGKNTAQWQKSVEAYRKKIAHKVKELISDPLLKCVDRISIVAKGADYLQKLEGYRESVDLIENSPFGSKESFEEETFDKDLARRFVSNRARIKVLQVEAYLHLKEPSKALALVDGFMKSGIKMVGEIEAYFIMMRARCKSAQKEPQDVIETVDLLGDTTHVPAFIIDELSYARARAEEQPGL